MQMTNIRMKTKVERLKLLETLRQNLTRHSSIVQEARNGYIQKAKMALENRMEQLRKGELVSLHFNLALPMDYSAVYKAAISMLEWNTDTHVELAPDEFRQLVNDEWDWQSSFLGSSMRYSKQAFDWMNDLSGGSLVSPPDDDTIGSVR